MKTTTYEIVATKEVEFDIAEVTILSVDEASRLKPEQLQTGDYWWLRQQNPDPNWVFAVDPHGNIERSTQKRYNGVRPVMKLTNIKGLVCGDKFVAGLEHWTMLSDDLALCDREVGKCFFRASGGAYKTGTWYEKSDLKRWLENWALEKGIYTTAQLGQMQGRA